MKKILFAVMITSLCSTAFSKDWQQSISDGFSNAVEYSKETYQSVKDSIAGDPDAANYIDVLTHEEFVQNVEFSITKVTPLDNQRYEINVGLKNLADKPVRLMSLCDDREVLLLDGEGFAYPLAENLVYEQQQEFILVPEKAGIRAKWIFRNVEAEPVKIRIFGQDYSL